MSFNVNDSPHHRESNRKSLKYRAWEPKIGSTCWWWRTKVLIGLAIVALFSIQLLLSGSYLAHTHSSRVASTTDDITADDVGPADQQRHRREHSNLRTGDAEGVVYYLLREPLMADAIVVGSGLAGLTAALTILDRGGTVILLEKEPILGGNSNKASSGINACCLEQDRHQHNNDTLALFRDDTVRSAGEAADLALIGTLVEESAAAVEWLHERVGVDLSVLVQLGGHSRRRTHRPQRGFVGAELINAMESAVRAYEPAGRVSIRVDTQVQRIVRLGNDDAEGRVLGVISEGMHGEYGRLRSDHVILATGGFASDRSRGSYLEKFRPELLSFPATAGGFSTGDGIAMAEAIGATTRDMEKIQLHPTGFVDPTDRPNPNKVLAAEMLRGVGGILLNRDGERFCNELGTRSYITDRMLGEDRRYAMTKRWNRRSPIPTFYLVLSQGAAKLAARHVAVYRKKGLLRKVVGIESLAEYMKVSTTTLRKALVAYQSNAESSLDEFGKTVFENLPYISSTTTGREVTGDVIGDVETFFVGEVTPVLHYCMGGITIDADGNVLADDGTPIPGLHAAGEVTGGVHGNNRLGGNSLLECAVFGGVVGRKIPIDEEITSSLSPYVQGTSEEGEALLPPPVPNPLIPMYELSQHRTVDDCWVALRGQVYDLSRFADRHPGGARSIQSLAGTDATRVFSKGHSDALLDRIRPYLVGTLQAAGPRGEEDVLVEDDEEEDSGEDEVDGVGGSPAAPLPDVSPAELGRHSRADDCWVSLHGVVYDLTSFLSVHPGGPYVIEKQAGRDGTVPFEVLHRDTGGFGPTMRRYAVGRLRPSPPEASSSAV